MNAYTDHVISLSQLEARLQHFDGKHLDSLARVAETLPLEGSTIDQLFALAERSDPAMRTAITWLLKNLRSRGTNFSAPQVTKVIEQLCAGGPWESRLQLLQMVPNLVIPVACTDELFHSLVPVLTEGNKFVRAWAYAALHALASQHREYLREVVPLLDQGLHDEAASVRARLRQLEPLDFVSNT